MQENIINRFEAKIEMIPECGCWIWMGAERSCGYGQIKINNKRYCAHRVSFEIYKGTIPAGLLICHRCDTPSCVNPNHLFLGTYKDNIQDAIHKKRWHHPGHGHGCNQKGECNFNVRLTVKDIEKIRNDNRSFVVIANEYGISAVHASRIKRRLRW